MEGKTELLISLAAFVWSFTDEMERATVTVTYLKVPFALHRRGMTAQTFPFQPLTSNLNQKNPPYHGKFRAELLRIT